MANPAQTIDSAGRTHIVESSAITYPGLREYRTCCGRSVGLAAQDSPQQGKADCLDCLDTQ